MQETSFKIEHDVARGYLDVTDAVEPDDDEMSTGMYDEDDGESIATVETDVGVVCFSTSRVLTPL